MIFRYLMDLYYSVSLGIIDKSVQNNAEHYSMSPSLLPIWGRAWWVLSKSGLETQHPASLRPTKLLRMPGRSRHAQGMRREGCDLHMGVYQAAEAPSQTVSRERQTAVPKVALPIPMGFGWFWCSFFQGGPWEVFLLEYAPISFRKD